MTLYNTHASYLQYMSILIQLFKHILLVVNVILTYKSILQLSYQNTNNYNKLRYIP